MKIGKINISKPLFIPIVASIVLIIGSLIAYFIIVYKPFVPKPKLIEVQLVCYADYCMTNHPGPAMVYGGVDSAEHCDNIGGKQIGYYGITGDYIYAYCAPR